MRVLRQVKGSPAIAGSGRMPGFQVGEMVEPLRDGLPGCPGFIVTRKSLRNDAMCHVLTRDEALLSHRVIRIASRKPGLDNPVYN